MTLKGLGGKAREFIATQVKLPTCAKHILLAQSSLLLRHSAVIKGVFFGLKNLTLWKRLFFFCLDDTNEIKKSFKIKIINHPNSLYGISIVWQESSVSLICSHSS